MWSPPDDARAPAPVGRVKTMAAKAQAAEADPKPLAPPGGMATLSGFESLLTFGAAGQSPVRQEGTPPKPVVATPPPAPALIIEAAEPEQRRVRPFTEKDDEPEPVTLIGMGINPALGRSASVFDHLAYEGRDWTEDEIDRVSQKSQKRSWERRRREAPVWPWLVSSVLFIAGVALMLGNLTGTYLSVQPAGFLVSAIGLLILHSKATHPIRLKHLSAIVAIMLAVTVLSGTRSYASNQSPAPSLHESPR